MDIDFKVTFIPKDKQRGGAERPGRKSSGGVHRQAFSSERGASIAAGEGEDDCNDQFCHVFPLAIYTFHLTYSNSLLVVPTYDVLNADWNMLNQAHALNAGWLLSFCASVLLGNNNYLNVTISCVIH